VEVFGSGDPELVEGVVLRGDATRLTLKQAAGTVGLQIGEITPASLAERFRTRTGKKPETDDRAAALFCLLEGDDEAARKLLGGKTDRIPDKYWRYAAKVASLRQSPDLAAKESEARDLFRTSEEAPFDYSRTGPSVETCRMLLRGFATTAFVARNRVAIANRAAGGREYWFCADLLKPVGPWKSARSTKSEPCWTCEKDGDPGKTPATTVDLTFTAFPNTEYRCWVYVGACCQETFTFFVQGTEMTVSNPKVSKEPQPVEPGGTVAAPVKLSLVSLKKTHAQHNGPKTPAQWAWVAVPLPKYASAGVKVVRLLTDQQGFSIAYAAVTTQKEPPRDAELKEFERAVKDASGPAPKAVAAPAVARPGKSVYAEDFSKGKGRFGGGGEIVEAGAGVKALGIPPKGVTVGGFSLVTKPSTTVRFRVKALIDLDFFECLTWIAAKNAAAWYHVNGLKKGEWRTVEFKFGDMTYNYVGAPIMGETVESMLLYYLNRPDDSRILITDFEIRD
jgi:hypothetical protein